LETEILAKDSCQKKKVGIDKKKIIFAKILTKPGRRCIGL